MMLDVQLLGKLNLNKNKIGLDASDAVLASAKEGIGIGYCLKKVALANPELEIINLEETLPDEKIIMVYNENTITSSTKEFIKVLSDKERN